MKKWKTNGLSNQLHKCPQCSKVDRFKAYAWINPKNHSLHYKYICVSCGFETNILDPKTIVMR